MEGNAGCEQLQIVCSYAALALAEYPTEVSGMYTLNGSYALASVAMVSTESRLLCRTSALKLPLPPITAECKFIPVTPVCKRLKKEQRHRRPQCAKG